jgi:hypothetical protein
MEVGGLFNQDELVFRPSEFTEDVSAGLRSAILPISPATKTVGTAILSKSIYAMPHLSTARRLEPESRPAGFLRPTSPPAICYNVSSPKPADWSTTEAKSRTRSVCAQRAGRRGF